MSIKRHNPKGVALMGRYSHAVELPPGQRLLYVSGQVGVDSKGKIAAGIEKQCDLVWKNIGAILRSAGMGYGDIVKINGYLTDARYIGAYRSVRDKYVHDPMPASTLALVAGLASPDMLVEVEVVASKV
ncbi:RidA family protein [Reyranella sp. CPCC 100927]|uniref:RidA family protein n=1 Tax=Reyranella sp. CPCC 100927 TaxID=2599616 RepID=UPI0011B4487B|nr:RidA family protein [Reyranella sp. CPCC 100927]TWT13983.1 RidA family protein [Reyranella sp. CPCC 100927]